jgi:hypothetical protein
LSGREGIVQILIIHQRGLRLIEGRSSLTTVRLLLLTLLLLILSLLLLKLHRSHSLVLMQLLFVSLPSVHFLLLSAKRVELSSAQSLPGIKKGDIPGNHSAEPELEPFAFAAVVADASAEASNR